MRDALRAVFGAVPGLVTRARRNPPPEGVTLAALLLAAGLILLGGVVGSPEAFPPAAQVLPLLVGGLLLRRRAMRWLLGGVGLALACDLVVLGWAVVRPGALVTVTVTGLIAHEFARSREETGLGGLRGDTVLVELRRRLALQGTLPPVSPPWHAESVLRAAGGGPFAGDFVVSSCADDGRRLDLALVDVSGKGVEAGTRALLLSGALGGLLGAVEPSEFLPAANDYLFRQDWEEGFATAVHLTVHLDSGAYVVTSAGHPPTARLHADRGRWALHETPGPALGLVPQATFPVDRGVLGPGDALILYTDGLVEIPGRDLSDGIDRLLGAAERLVGRGFAGGAVALLDLVGAGSSDDRGLVLVRRDA